MPARFRGIFILGCLNRLSSENLCCKPLPGGISVQNISHGPVYAAGFAVYITLCIPWKVAILSATEILYEPLPVGRMGVQIDDQKVVIAQDYSCFASMLEEYIAHGALSIAIPKSAPEAKNIGEIPLLLRRRLRIINDDPEEESIERLFFGIRRELGIAISEDTRQLKFPKTVSRELVTAVLSATANTKRLMLAYNNQFQAEVNVESATKAFRFTRQHISDVNSKIILAQLEGLQGTMNLPSTIHVRQEQERELS